MAWTTTFHILLRDIKFAGHFYVGDAAVK